VGPLEGAVARALDAHAGPFCVQSFNPMTLKWFLAHRPRFLRGLIAYSFPPEEVQMNASTRFLLRNLLFAPLCKPHYVAYEGSELARHKLRRLRKMRARGTLVLAWTVRSAAAAREVAPHADNIIFEGFAPPTAP